MTEMASNVAMKKHNPIMHNCSYNIKSTLKISLIILILHLFSLPAILLNGIYNITSGISINPDESFLIVAVAATGIAGTAGIIIALTNFRYLYNKSQVDMCLSHPLTRKQRFISDFFSGLASYIIPFLISSAVSGIIMLIGHIAMDGKTFMLLNSQTKEYDTPYVCTFFSDYAPFIGRVLFTGILTMLMLYTLTVLVSVCCGTIFETVLYTFFANAAIPIFIYIIFESFFNSLYGISCTDKLITLFTWTSPAGAIASLGFSLDYLGYTSYGRFNSISVTSWTIGFLIVTAVMFAAAYFLYMKRKAEQVSKPFVFKGLYYITVTFIILSITALFYIESISEIIPFLITTLTVYLLLEIVANRGFKKLWQGLIRYTVTIGIFLGFSAIVEATDCFGAVTRVPSPESVSEIYIGYAGIYDTYPSYNFNYLKGNEEEIKDLKLYTITTPENIENIINAHTSIVDDYKKTKDNYYSSVHDYTSFSICYKLKNGTKIIRSYDYVTPDAIQILMNVDVSDEYKQQAAEYIKTYYTDFYDSLGNDSYYNSYSPNMSSETRMFPLTIRSAEDYLANNYTNGSMSKTVYPTKGILEELQNALAADIVNMSADEYFTPSDALYIVSGYGRELFVNESYVETMRVLDKYGYLDVYENTDTRDILLSNDFNEANHRIQIFSYDDYTAYVKNDYVYTVRNGCYIYESEYGKYVLDYSDELAEILSVARSQYITNEPCYTITVNGQLFVIPTEYTETAEKLYSKSSETAYLDMNGYNIYYRSGVDDIEFKD